MAACPAVADREHAPVSWRRAVGARADTGDGHTSSEIRRAIHYKSDRSPDRWRGFAFCAADFDAHGFAVRAGAGIYNGAAHGGIAEARQRTNDDQPGPADAARRVGGFASSRVVHAAHRRGADDPEFLQAPAGEPGLQSGSPADYAAESEFLALSTAAAVHQFMAQHPATGA